MLTIKQNGLLQSIIKHCEKIIYKVKNLTREQFNNDEDISQTEELLSKATNRFQLTRIVLVDQIVG